uniref:CD3 gamma/delta n=1 Tax=Takifugu rubripes TaxID=31033 RepID=A0A674P9M6_TAKRU
MTLLQIQVCKCRQKATSFSVCLLFLLLDRIVVKSQPNGILLSCKTPLKIKTANGHADDLKLEYKDENSGEYECEDTGNEGVSQKIYVKFRTCDNCVELELVSLTGILMGNLVATVLIGVAVYLTASHRRSDVSSSTRKSSDRQHLVPSESRNRPPNDHYQVGSNLSPPPQAVKSNIN